MVSKYIKKILEAEVYDVATESPLDPAPLLSDRLGLPVMLKREDLQPVFSFKLRGAYNRIRKLDEAARKRGVITASAGNHAQGVALAASRLGIRAHIVMGRNTPEIKVNAVARLGGHVILHGDNYDEAAALFIPSMTRMSLRARGLSAWRCCDNTRVIFTPSLCRSVVVASSVVSAPG